MIATAILLAAASTPAISSTTAYVLPTRLEAGHFYAVPETVDGGQLKLLVDTGGGGGGGMYWVTSDAAKRLLLKTRACKLGDQTLPVTLPPRYKPDRAIPAPLQGACGVSVLVNTGHPYDVDGQLGAGYLPGRVWTFDYPAQRMVLESAAWRPSPDARDAPLGFPRDAHGKPTSGFARITIHVDGKPFDMLVDTGATAHPSAKGAKASATPTVGGQGAGSYMVSSVIDRWHRDHPDWRMVVGGDDLSKQHPSRIIEVPNVEIAGWSVGSVWFIEQPDYAFHGFMSSMMDKQVEGAVGGNVFSHFAMTLDYPGAKAWFRCVAGCRPATPPPAP